MRPRNAFRKSEQCENIKYYRFLPANTYALQLPLQLIIQLLLYFCLLASHHQEVLAAAAASDLGHSTTLPGVNHQPAALHWLCSAGVHLPGQEAWLWEPAHHHWCLLGALWDLGGEKLAGGYCTVHTHTEERSVNVLRSDVKAKLSFHKRKECCFFHRLTFEEGGGGLDESSASRAETQRQTGSVIDVEMEKRGIPMEKICFAPFPPPKPRGQCTVQDWAAWEEIEQTEILMCTLGEEENIYLLAS